VGADEKVWTEVGERFASLGRLLRQRYQEEAERMAADRPTGVEHSLHHLADALDEVFSSVGETVRDTAVAEEARRAARSLGDALSATFEDVDAGLHDRFKQTGTRGPSDDPGMGND
jgi:hypothetical protein